MKKVLTIGQAISLSKKLNKEGKKIVLSGGIFDIIHIGHIRFLQRAKKSGDLLFVLLESDIAAKKRKGKNRPINSQTIRAEVLSAIEFINYIILLPEMKNNEDYDKIVTQIRPMYIAVTKNDKGIEHKKRQAKAIGAKVVSVLSLVSNESTSKLARIIEKENNL